MSRASFPALALVFAGLAGCGTNPGMTGFFDIGRQLVLVAGDPVGRRSNVLGAEGLSTTDAALRAFPRPLLKVTQEKIGLSAAVGLVARKGANATWRSADDRTFTLYDGLLIQTRGFGNDLMSARVPAINQGPNEVVREHYYLGGDERIRMQRFFCQVQPLGRQQTDLVGLTVSTDVISETCANDDHRFENRYWFEPGGGMLKSVQWGGPEIGLLRIEFVPRTPAAASTEGQPRVFIAE